ncbi:hypothetical protein ONZ43_g220 [Nemania bipapillata]|uniref:Uncharacterized protein n=1 Tax=Nemania bipapillata TaxID=110536 RepID=A0ACC2J9E1_9PEZI|nr:hypothetical protein ONZ43_g220 [Nemania bipapillata]
MLRRRWKGLTGQPSIIQSLHRLIPDAAGAEVTRYQLARPTWDGSWAVRSRNDNMQDRKLLRKLTDALQEQKDYATRAVQKNPGRYPGLEPVSAPGCTLKLYWQHKSSYR